MNLIRYLRRVDSTLFLTVISLGIICLMIIGSATHANVHMTIAYYTNGLQLYS